MQVKKILFITLSNIGDAVLTLPALDCLRQDFPAASITIICGVRSAVVFRNNPAFERVIVFDKRAKLRQKLRLFRELSSMRFDMVVDLRNSFFGAFLPAKYRTSPFTFFPGDARHMRDRHLYKVKKAIERPRTEDRGQRTEGRGQRIEENGSFGKSIYIEDKDKKYINDALKENGIKEEDKIIVIAAGARSHIKRWPRQSFIDLALLLIREFGCKIILAGDNDDAAVNEYIADGIKSRVPAILDLAGRTNIAQLAYLLKKSRALIANDSAVLHLGSYLNIPTIAIFGPTNDFKYGPWSQISATVKKEIFCRPCEKAQCRFNTLGCMDLVKVQDVMAQVKNILDAVQDRGQKTEDRRQKTGETCVNNDYKRILIVRTDRIGDVLLSTPVIKALRDRYPCAYIAMMVGLHAREVIEGNPYLDKVIIYDKDGLHHSWKSSFEFAKELSKFKFDLAIILHPANRPHLLAFLARIPRRLGYNYKFGFLLSDRIRHIKHLGEKHEIEYNLDLVRYLGIEPQNTALYMPLSQATQKWKEECLKAHGVGEGDRLLALHPAASCPSKIWPPERMAQIADNLCGKYGFKVLLVSGPKDMDLAQTVAGNMRHPAINLAGKTTVGQLAAILKRCSLFISNDSGPVHIASAVGTPVISIFGRSQKGLGPRRWGPAGKKNKFLHKEAGCIECLAHNCKKGFACLKAITVDDVISAADEIMNK